MYYCKFKSSIAPLILVGDESGLKILFLDIKEAKYPLVIESDWVENAEFFADTIEQIEQYLNGQAKDFNVKLNPSGTEFQKNVWAELSNIPFGNVCTYKDIAGKIGNKKASRAVGSANGKNPIPIIVPCHRVIGVNNKLTGFAYGLEIKKRLLDIEKLNGIYK